jgi:hypothetical protein
MIEGSAMALRVFIGLFAFFTVGLLAVPLGSLGLPIRLALTLALILHTAVFWALRIVLDRRCAGYGFLEHCISQIAGIDTVFMYLVLMLAVGYALYHFVGLPKGWTLGVTSALAVGGVVLANRWLPVEELLD